MRQVPAKAATPSTRLVELPGRGVTRVGVRRSARRRDAHAHPRGHLHGRTQLEAALRPPLEHFRVVAIDAATATDQCRPRFRLEDCADDIAALAEVLGLGRFVAVGYSMGGGMVAQLLDRPPSLLSGLVLCTARNVRHAAKLAALALPTAAVAIRWNPFRSP